MAKSKKTVIPEMDNVAYRMDAEGFDYCFRSYSDFQYVHDKKFHKLREAYCEAANKLEKYVKAHAGESS